MGNYRVKAKLMIGDGDDDNDNDDDDVFFSMLEHANGFGNCALLEFASFSITRELFLLLGRHLAPPSPVRPR